MTNILKHLGFVFAVVSATSIIGCGVETNQRNSGDPSVMMFEPIESPRVDDNTDRFNGDGLMGLPLRSAPCRKSAARWSTASAQSQT